MTRRQLLAGAAVLALPATAAALDSRASDASAMGKARLEAAKRGLAQVDRGSAAGADSGPVRVWARRVADAELALCVSGTERKAVLAAFIRRAKDNEQVVQALYKTKAVALVELREAEYFRADAEALLAEEDARQADGGLAGGAAQRGSH